MLEVTTTDYNVKEGLECQSDFSEFLHDTQTLQTPMINFYLIQVYGLKHVTVKLHTT
jgi:phosphoribosylaminoimidazole-succinocarboxamide synthase